MAYEAIVNRALAEHPVWIMCPYDRRVLAEEVVEGASRTHPEVHTNGGHIHSCFTDPG
jgi:hypothetical protein